MTLKIQERLLAELLTINVIKKALPLSNVHMWYRA